MYPEIETRIAACEKKVCFRGSECAVNMVIVSYNKALAVIFIHLARRILIFSPARTQCKIYLIDFWGKEPLKNTSSLAKIHGKIMKQLQSIRTGNSYTRLHLVVVVFGCVAMAYKYQKEL